MRGAVDTTPGDLLLRRHKTRNIVWHQHAVAPIAQFNARDQLGLHGAAHRVRAGRLFVIMIGDAMHEPEADPAICKELEYLRSEARDSRRGIPQGSPLSPLLANLYMRRFVLRSPTGPGQLLEST